MTKKELRDKIRAAVLQTYSKQPKVSLDNPEAISLDNERFPALVKFPTLREAIIQILTDQYDLFIKDIEWVAPRPTTFRIVLGNDQVFYLIYTDRTWIAKVEGKKYYLLNINEEQNCIEAIARILSYGAKAEPDKEEVDKEKPYVAPSSSSGGEWQPDEAELEPVEEPAPEEPESPEIPTV